MYLKNSPLVKSETDIKIPISTIILNHGNFDNKNIQDQQSLSSVPTKNISPNPFNIQEKNFPFEEGRRILTDYSSLTGEMYPLKGLFTNQDFVNKNIKSVIVKSINESSYDEKCNLTKLLTHYKIGICDLYNFSIIKNIQDLKTFKFNISHLKVDTNLFNASHLRTLYKLTFNDIITSKFRCSICNVESIKFTTEELYTLNFDFTKCIEYSLETIYKKPKDDKKLPPSKKHIDKMLLDTRISITKFFEQHTNKSYLETFNIQRKVLEPIFKNSTELNLILKNIETVSNERVKNNVKNNNKK